MKSEKKNPTLILRCLWTIYLKGGFTFLYEALLVVVPLKASRGFQYFFSSLQVLHTGSCRVFCYVK